MLLSTNSLKGFSLHALDGEIGRVRELYFDDSEWTVRYLVVDTGTWLSSRLVLVPSVALGRVNVESRTIEVSLTKDLIEKSPERDFDKPVSRQYEIRYHDYYGFPYYWAGAGITGGPTPAQLMALEPLGVVVPEDAAEDGDPHLRSTAHIAGFLGYHVHATDGDIGHVDDFLVDEKGWCVRYVVANTSNFGLGHRVLIAPEFVGLVSWADARIAVGLSKEAIESAPKWDQTTQVDRGYETALYVHYKRVPYLESDAKTVASFADVAPRAFPRTSPPHATR